MTVLLKTVHGSHLYGLNHEGSDLDYYIVTSSGNSKQSIKDGIDTNTVSFDKFVKLCFDGVPQALEAMFSQVAEIDEISYFRNGYRAGGSKVIDTYRRTIKSLSYDERHTVKYRRHAVRMALNLNDIVRHGRFNPTLSGSDRVVVKYVAQLSTDYFKEQINGLSPIEIFDSWQVMLEMGEWLHEDYY